MAAGLGLVTGFVLYSITHQLMEFDVGNLLYPAVIASVIVAAVGVYTLSREPEPGEPMRLGFLLVVLSCGAFLWVAYAIQNLIMNRSWATVGEGSSTRYSSIAYAVVIGLTILWYAYRHGQADAARWAALCLALAGPILLGTSGGNFASTLIVGVTAVAAGTVLALRAGDMLPWDAIGVCLAIAGALVSAHAIGDELGFDGSVASMMLSAGTGFALSAGVVRLARSGQMQGSGVFAGVLTLGLTGMFLMAYPLAGETFRLAVSSRGMPPLAMPGMALVGAVVIVVLFVIGRPDRVATTSD